LNKHKFPDILPLLDENFLDYDEEDPKDVGHPAMSIIHLDVYAKICSRRRGEREKCFALCFVPENFVIV
jgi:hypothetical protein